MTNQYSQLRKKEVVNVRDGRVLGCIDDLVLCLPEGAVEAIVVPGGHGCWNPFQRTPRIIIPWCQILKIGDDVILVELKKGGRTIEK